MSGFADFPALRSLENGLASLGERGSAAQAVVGGTELMLHRRNGQHTPTECLLIEDAL